MAYVSTTPRNLLEHHMRNTASEAMQPPHDIERISYGVISNINFDTSQVKVKFLTSDGIVDDSSETNSYFPLLSPIEDIHLKYGAIRIGLTVRVFWRGKLKPTQGYVEVIGDENFKFLSKQPLTNDVDVGPWHLLSGGMGI